MFRAAALVGFVAALIFAYNQFFRKIEPIILDPEALADAWDDTVAQFGVPPIFPPQEDLRVGDLYGVLGDDSRNQRLKLKFPRAIKLDHLGEADKLLATAYDNVFVLPTTPEGPSGVIKQPECETAGCFKTLITRKQLPIVIFPGFNSARDRHAGLQASFLAQLGQSFFSGASDDTRSVSISIPYVETYGLPSLQASGLLYDFCNDARRPLVCDEETVRTQLSMTAGASARERVPNSKLYKYRVYIVLVSTVYLTRSLKYSFSADSAAGLRADAYKQILKAARDASVPTASTGAAVADDSPATSTSGKPGADRKVATEAAQNAVAQQRQQMLAAIEKAGSGPGGAINVEDAASNRVVIDLPLPRPVAIGFIPVIKEFKSNADVVEPE